MSNLLNVLLFTLIPVGATLASGIIAAFRPPGAKLGSYLQHFAAGTVFAAVADELLPEVISEHDPVATIFGFALGVAVPLVLRTVLEKKEDGKDAPAEEPTRTGNQATSYVLPGTSIASLMPKNSTFPTRLVAIVGVDIFIDGLLIGIGFAAGASQGILLTLALTLELLGLALATSASLGQAGVSRQASIISMFGLSLLLLIGATLGATLLSGLSGAPKEAMLAFGVAALLFLVTEELLVEAHQVEETPAITATFFVGFLLIVIVGMIV